MDHDRRPLVTAASLALATLLAAAGCGERSPETPVAGTPAAAEASDRGDDHEAMGSGHHGPTIDLGDAAAGPFRIRATRDEGEIVAGGDAPIDVWVDPTGDAAPRVVAVRFWIGDASGKGAIKAKASIEDIAEPTRWHTHAEIPDPMPPGSRLWVEVEDAEGTRTLASFELKN